MHAACFYRCLDVAWLVLCVGHTQCTVQRRMDGSRCRWGGGKLEWTRGRKERVFDEGALWVCEKGRASVRLSRRSTAGVGAQQQVRAM